MNKKIKSLPNQSNLEQIKADISALKSGMTICLRLSDFKEDKDIQDDNRANIKKLKEDFEDFQNNQNARWDIQKMIRKLEMLNNKVHDIEDRDLMNRKNMGNTSKAEDNYRFLYYKIFDEFNTLN